LQWARTVKNRWEIFSLSSQNRHEGSQPISFSTYYP
jgi:hypothetical protein